MSGHDPFRGRRVRAEGRLADVGGGQPRGMSLTQLYEHACATPSDINEHLPALHDLAHDLDAQVIIELGVRTGNSTVAWLAALEQTGGHLYAVDIDPSPPVLADHPRLTFLQGDDLSPQVLEQLPAEADIVFIDTLHTYAHTSAELEVYRPLVRPGGRIVLHDTAVEAFPHHTGPLVGQPSYPVRRAVEEFVAEHDLEVEWRTNNHGLAVIHIPA